MRCDDGGVINYTINNKKKKKKRWRREVVVLLCVIWPVCTRLDY